MHSSTEKFLSKYTFMLKDLVCAPENFVVGTYKQLWLKITTAVNKKRIRAVNFYTTRFTCVCPVVVTPLCAVETLHIDSFQPTHAN